MKRLLAISGIIALIFGSLQAQKFEKGDQELNFTVGLGSTWTPISSVNTNIPPIAVSYDYGWRDDLGPGLITLGGYAGIYQSKSKGDWGYKFTSTYLAARSTYHYQFNKNFDTYGGALLGFRFTSSKEFGNWPVGDQLDYSTSDTDLIIAVFAGAKYYVTNQIAAMAEIGYGVAWLNLGVSFKL